MGPAGRKVASIYLSILGRDPRPVEAETRTERGGRKRHGQVTPGSPFKEILKQIAPQRRSVKVSTNFHLIIIYTKCGFPALDTLPSGSAGRKMGKGSN